MKLKITSSTQQIYSTQEAIELYVPTSQGVIGILPGHVDLVSTLQIGEIRIKLKDKTSKSVVVNGGLLQLRNDEILILADEASLTEDLIKEEISQAIKNAEDKISSKLDATELIQLEKKLRYEKFKQQAAQGL